MPLSPTTSHDPAGLRAVALDGFTAEITDKSTGVSTSQGHWEIHRKNPFNWPEKKKWRQYLAGCLVTMLVGLNSTVIATPGVMIAEQFGVDTSNPNIDNTVWPIAAWNTGAAFGPMLGIPFLEAFGIRNGYFITYALFFLFVIPQALAPNFATLIVARAFAGVFGGVLMNSLECFIADTWLTDPERDLPVTLFIIVYLAGVTLGPAFGAVASVLDWRWVFYISLIIYGALFPILLLIIKETRGPVILARLTKAQPPLSQSPSASSSPSTSQAKDTPPPTTSTAPSLKTLLHDAIVRPFHMLATEPVVFCFTLWSAFCFGIVYTCIQSIAQVYSTAYDFTDAQCGLIQLSLFAGMLLGVLPCLPQNAYYQRRTRLNNGIPVPEARLPTSVIASLLGLAGGLFWYAWASTPHVHWIVPTIGLALIGFGVQVVVTAAALYITDAYSKFAGSAVSCLAFGENMMAAWLPLASRQMYTVLGFQWASSLLGFAALLLTLAPVVLLFYGEGVRGRSHFIREARYLG